MLYEVITREQAVLAMDGIVNLGRQGFRAIKPAHQRLAKAHMHPPLIPHDARHYAGDILKLTLLVGPGLGLLEQLAGLGQIAGIVLVV